MKLIPNWRRGLSMFSVQAKLAAIAIIGGWQQLPADLQAHVPSTWAAGAAIAVLVLGIVGRFVCQPGLAAEPAQEQP